MNEGNRPQLTGVCTVSKARRPHRFEISSLGRSLCVEHQIDGLRLLLGHREQGEDDKAPVWRFPTRLL